MQLIAAAEAGVNLQYTTYGRRHVNGFEQFYKKMVDNEITVGKIYNVLLSTFGWRNVSIFQQVINDLLEKKEYE